MEYVYPMICTDSIYENYYITSVTEESKTSTSEDSNFKARISLKCDVGEMWTPIDPTDPYKKEDLATSVELKKKVVSVVVTRTDGISMYRIGPLMVNGNLIQTVLSDSAGSQSAGATFGNVTNAPSISVESVDLASGAIEVVFEETPELLETFGAAAPIPGSKNWYSFNVMVTSIGVDYCARQAGDSITRVETSLDSGRKKLYDPWIFEHPLYLKQNTTPPKRQDIVPQLSDVVPWAMESNSSQKRLDSRASEADMTLALSVDDTKLKWLYSVEELSSIFLDITAHPFLEL